MSLRPTVWFSRLADVPGVNFAGSPGVDRRRLRGHDAVPRVTDYGLWWFDHTSASPAHERAFSVDTSDYTAERLVQHVYETIELPGAPEEYHFALQLGVERLWTLRMASPTCLTPLEEFARLDLALVEATPWSLRYPHDAGATMVSLPGIDRLIVLLEREGAHREALALAQRVAQLGTGTRTERIAQRVATLDTYA